MLTPVPSGVLLIAVVIAVERPAQLLLTVAGTLPVTAQLQALCQGRRDFLRYGADLHAMNMSIFAQAAIHK